MTGHSPSTLFRHKQKHNPSTQAILVIFVALFILFLWLHFILAQEIESLGRQIQTNAKKLSEIERRKDALRKEIAIAGSQENLSNRAWALGYRAQTPIYLLYDHPLPQATSKSQVQVRQASTTSTAETPARQSHLVWDALARQFNALQKTKAEP